MARPLAPLWKAGPHPARRGERPRSRAASGAVGPRRRSRRGRLRGGRPVCAALSPPCSLPAPFPSAGGGGGDPSLMAAAAALQSKAGRGGGGRPCPVTTGRRAAPAAPRASAWRARRRRSETAAPPLPPSREPDLAAAIFIPLRRRRVFLFNRLNPPAGSLLIQN